MHAPRLSPSAVVPAALALAGVVAVGSGGASVWTTPRTGALGQGQVLAVVGLVCVAGGLLVLATTLARHKAMGGEGKAPPRRSLLMRALPGAAVGLVLASLLAISRASFHAAQRARSTPGAPPSPDHVATPLKIVQWWESLAKAGGATRAGEGLGGTGSGGFDLAPWLVAIVAAGLAAGALGWYRSRSAVRPEGADGEADAERARDLVEDTIGAMLRDPDPRTAIIGAYARLLEGLAAGGAPRRAHEAPMEHLRRVLTLLRVRAAPLRELTGLFEVARFSHHRVTADHRRRALEVLREVAGDLAGPGRGDLAGPVTGLRAGRA